MASKLYTVIIRVEQCMDCSAIGKEATMALESRDFVRFNELKEIRKSRENCSNCRYVKWHNSDLKRIENVSKYYPSWAWYKVYTKPDKRSGRVGEFVEKVFNADFN